MIVRHFVVTQYAKQYRATGASPSSTAGGFVHVKLIMDISANDAKIARRDGRAQALRSFRNLSLGTTYVKEVK